MLDRIVKLRSIMQEKNLDAVLCYKPENRFYITGFTGSAGYGLITKDKEILITDFRYLEQAKKECLGFSLEENSKLNPVSDILRKLPIQRMGIEEDYVTYGQYKELAEKLENTELVPLEGAITKLRAVKSEEEIALLQRAAAITDEAFTHILSFIRPGISEEDIALELEFFMKKKGATRNSFDPIVASGERSALPHGRASCKLVEAGDLLTLDFGCVYKGYASDMTRTLVVGEASQKQKEIYYTVLEAQEKSLAAVKPGLTGIQLDNIAREIIADKGFGQYFGHGLGHGVGLEVHELPHVNSIGKAEMLSGNVITIEPGIYLPGYGGVRIEDLVVVTESGYRVLTTSTKELIELKG